MGQVVVRLMPNILSLNLTNMSVTSCLTTQNTLLSPTLTLTIQIISQVSRMFSMPLTTMPNKLPRVFLSMVKMLNCVRLRLMHQFIIMVLKLKAMTL
ncbi:Uncharacterised protein [Streptococcus pneumoniae]|nr:Uncharacterised protein [Streptococcus pneumoniae]CIV80714.1 Uncharacterised protein [Streptococcus pneumoniae]CIW06199.1 Uncharacterised protein [Streptococcus pneumoniae]